jgi:hypothetical protein
MARDVATLPRDPDALIDIIVDQQQEIERLLTMIESNRREWTTWRRGTALRHSSARSRRARARQERGEDAGSRTVAWGCSTTKCLS